MVAAISGNGKTKASKPRLIGIAQLDLLMLEGSEIRRGTRLRSVFPEWEWQLFDKAGEFIGPIHWKAVQQWATVHGRERISSKPGLNRGR